jgi:hypothetical protein
MKDKAAENTYERLLAATRYEDFVKATYEVLIDQNIGIVHPKKLYVGKKTGHKHEIDVSIELQVAGLSILILIECKHYKNKVEISDVLELAQRIDDVGAHKGVLVSTIGFQPGALKVAEGYGIALVTTAPMWSVVSGLTPRSGRSTVVGITLQLLNDSSYSMSNPVASWKGIINYLWGKSRCSYCKEVIHYAFDYYRKGIPQDICVKCFLRQRKCVSCGRTAEYIGKGQCEECFFSGLEIPCGDCGEVTRSLVKGFCQGCFSPISESRFTQSSWYRCSCKQMIHISDIDARTTKCKCGYIFRYKVLKDIFQSEVFKEKSKYFIW